MVHVAVEADNHQSNIHCTRRSSKYFTSSGNPCASSSNNWSETTWITSEVLMTTSGAATSHTSCPWTPSYPPCLNHMKSCTVSSSIPSHLDFSSSVYRNKNPPSLCYSSFVIQYTDVTMSDFENKHFEIKPHLDSPKRSNTQTPHLQGIEAKLIICTSFKTIAFCRRTSLFFIHRFQTT